MWPTFRRKEAKEHRCEIFKCESKWGEQKTLNHREHGKIIGFIGSQSPFSRAFNMRLNSYGPRSFPPFSWKTRVKHTKLQRSPECHPLLQTSYVWDHQGCQRICLRPSPRTWKKWAMRASDTLNMIQLLTTWLKLVWCYTLWKILFVKLDHSPK